MRVTRGSRPVVDGIADRDDPVRQRVDRQELDRVVAAHRGTAYAFATTPTSATEASPACWGTIRTVYPNGPDVSIRTSPAKACRPAS